MSDDNEDWDGGTYYDPTIETILVPVKVRYHDATGIVYGFTTPSRDDVENALKKKEESDHVRHERLLGDALRKVLVKAGVIYSDACITGPELLYIATEYAGE